MIRACCVERDCGCNCRVQPPQCWPRATARVHSRVWICGTARLNVVVRNTGPVTRAFRVEVIPPQAASVSQANFVLAPQQSAVSTITLVSSSREEQEVVVAVHGCQDQRIIWRSRRSLCGVRRACSVEIEDRPDFEHHWYDHFTCVHPCCDQRPQAR